MPISKSQLHLASITILFFSLISIDISVPFVPKIVSNQPLVKAAFDTNPLFPVSHNKPVPYTSAKSVFIADINTGVVLYAKNPNQRLKPASLTKIMTALVAMDHYDDGSILHVINGASSLGSSAELKAGDELLFDDVLFALLVPSGNDAAVTLAENYPGGYYNFVDQMNRKALSLGLVNSHFANVSGVESPNHYTSAYDIAQVALSALKRSLFRNVVSTRKITLKSLDGHIYPLETTNTLLGKAGVLGIKTGWTPQAGECLVTYVDRQGHQIITSVLGSDDRFGESKRLIEWVYSNYTWE